LNKDEPDLEQATKMYEYLFGQVFEHDNYVMNGDIVDSFYKL